MAFVAALLIVCAVVQWNDPDPIRWVSYYVSSAAIVLGLRYANGMTHRIARWLAIFGIAASLIAVAALTITHFPDLRSLQASRILDGMSNAVPGNEIAKEIGGLVLTVSALGVALRRHSAEPEPGE